jgi:hypothetical protein
VSDDAYGLIMAISALLYAVVLFLRWRQGRILKRLIKSLEKDGKMDEIRKIVEEQQKK